MVAAKHPILVGGRELPEELEPAWHRLETAILNHAISLAQRAETQAAQSVTEQAS